MASESCADDRKGVGEALTGEHAGQPWSSEINLPVCRPSPVQGKATRGATLARAATRHRGVVEPVHACTLPVREPGDPRNSLAHPGGGRLEKAESRTSSMYVPGESDDLIVPTTRANKVGPKATTERAEGRRSSKGMVLTADHVPDTEPDQACRFSGRATARSPWLCVRSTRAKSRMR